MIASAADLRSAAPVDSSSSVATWARSLGDEIATTRPDHGPEPSGTDTTPAGEATLATASRIETTITPAAAGRAAASRRLVLRSPSRRPRWRPPTPTAIAVARRTRTCGRRPGPARLAATAPMASQMLEVTCRPSADRHEVLQLVEGRRSDELSRPEVVDGGEPL